MPSPGLILGEACGNGDGAIPVGGLCSGKQDEGVADVDGFGGEEVCDVATSLGLGGVSAALDELASPLSVRGLFPGAMVTLEVMNRKSEVP